MIILSLVLIPIVNSAEYPDYYNDYVNDFGKYFSANETAYITSILNEVRQNTTAQVVVATILDCSGDYNGYATSLATKWKIGKADKDNGLLILYCLDVKKIVVQTGYGLEGILPDGKIGRLLDDYYVPLRDQNKTKEGIIAVTEQLVKVINDNRDEVLSTDAGTKSNPLLTAIIMLLIFSLIFFVIYKIKAKKETNLKKTDKSKTSAFGKFIDILFWINLFVIVAIGFQVILVVLFIILLILKAIFGPKSISSPGFWGFGGGSSGFGGGGFSGGGFGGGGFGGGGASR